MPSKIQLTKIRRTLESFVKRKIPGFSVISKRDSLLMKYIAKLLFFNKGFMDYFVTTVYPRVYIPSVFWWENDNKFAITTLAHEYVHLYDRKRMGYFFNFLYLFPQNLSFLAVGAIWNAWFLLFLAFLLPLPSPTRAWLEYRAYVVSLACYYWLGDKKTFDSSEVRDWIVEQFVGSHYYWMFPFPKLLIKKLDEEFKTIVEDGKLSKELKQIKEIVDVF